MSQQQWNVERYDGTAKKWIVANAQPFATVRDANAFKTAYAGTVEAKEPLRVVQA